VRKIVNSTFVSLDGVINHMERWHFDYIDDESQELALEQLNSSDALLLGRNTYEAYAGVWPGRAGDAADRINHMPKYVVSNTLQDATWTNTSIIKGDFAAAIAELKQTGNRTILMNGYGPVAKELLRHGLLDELHLWVHPKFAGFGTVDDMIFTPGLDSRFELLGVRPLDSGVVLLSYRVAKPPGRVE
jgi:dihydrofolate reductase